jgi:hypothetical protein
MSIEPAEPEEIPQSRKQRFRDCGEKKDRMSEYYKYGAPNGALGR